MVESVKHARTGAGVTYDCRVCGTAGGATDVVLDLGAQPSAKDWPLPNDHSEELSWLAMWCCPHCGLAQLATDAPPAPEVIGVEPEALVAEASRLSAELVTEGLIGPGSSVTEFSSPHGGSWLPPLTALGLQATEGRAEVVIDSLGLMHEPDQASAVRERVAAVAPGGVLAVFFHSLGSIVAKRQWNDLRHGHYAYYSLTTLSSVFARSGMVAVDVLSSDLYGQSLLLVLRHGDDPRAGERSELLSTLLEVERQAGLNDPAVIREALSGMVVQTAGALRSYLVQAHRCGLVVYGYGAASRALTVFTRAGVGPELLPAIVDASPAKQGRVTPGSRIPIVPPSDMVRDQPHEILVLLPDLVPELVETYPELVGRFVAYDPGSPQVLHPDARVDRFDRSIAAQAALHDIVPGGAHTYARGSDQYPADKPSVLVRGRGALVWDLDNNCYVEYGSGLRSVTLGHTEPRVDAAVRKAIGDGINFSRPTARELRVAETFLELIPGAEMVKFAKNGSDVTTAAIKLARAATGKDKIAICDQSLFSVDDWFIAHTAMDAGIPAAVQREGIRFPFNDIAALERIFAEHHEELAAVIIQPATPTEEPAPGYLESIRGLCDRHDVVLIFDEIVTGFRWSPAGVQGLVGVVPDLACWAKGIGNGYPIAALTGKASVMDLGGLRTERRRVFSVSTTYGPETVGLAALEAVMKIYREEDPIGRMRNAGQQLKTRIDEVVTAADLREFVGVEGNPACLIYWTRDHLGIPSQSLRTVLMSELMSRGVLGQSLVTSTSHDCPMLIDHTVAAFEGAMTVYRRAVEDGEDTVLTGPPVAPALRAFAEPRRIIPGTRG
ncbi:glutamate-1-semialdehyde 2,1-aminomutase [Naumannella halotolerans]|uniref:Glutamate-1-semialdehyde aminotransferase n=1 Tax=Naumannella halotolerans TaxID=993414 RepID=A0A4R7J4D0_9ACTN|nr:glutamate-1-semialdehyde 2,1-aminomutase [Naumannella halotolerans]TDT31173.1 glutamate-1-semialdehyde aminotransferase [Naumannella halotolerans]